MNPYTRCTISGPTATVCSCNNLNSPACTSEFWECTTGPEARAICSTGCNPTQGSCTGQLSCSSPGCDCNSGAGVCSSCNEHGDPFGCCTDQYHYNCTWNNGACSGDSSSYQCQSTCGGKNQTDCQANGCTWTGGDPTTDSSDSSGIACATQCSQQTGGTCFDSCGNEHSCNRQSVPASTTIQGQKVLVPIDANDNLPTANNVPWNSQIVLDSNAANSTANPYSFSTTVSFHFLTAPIPQNYSAGYTKCTSDQTSCDASYHATTTPFPLGFAASGPISGIVSVTTAPASGYADVWFHYCDHTGDANWTDSSVCIPDTGSCGNGTKTQTDACGNSRIASCATACSFFQTFGGDVTFAGPLYDTPLPSSSYFISGR